MDLLTDVEDLYGNPILLGNGFSILNNNNFSYKNLIKEIIQNSEVDVKNILNKFNEKNIEEVLYKIQSSIEICKILDIPSKKIIKTETKLIRSFIDIISKLQPSSDSYFEPYSYHYGNQLKKFGSIFTTNYDLNIYFLVLKYFSRNNGLFTHSDNFSGSNQYLTFNNESNSSYESHIYYLHGNILLFGNNLEIFKVKKTDENSSIIDKIKENINNGKLPIIVTDGSPEYKLNKINGNKYLRFCFEEFKNHKSDSLVIYGHSLSDLDKHLIECINSNKNYKKIYFGLFKPTENKINLQKSKFNEELDVKFFDSEMLFNPDI